MVSKHKDLRFTLLVSLTIMATTLIGLLFVGFHDASSIFWPAAGFYTALYVIYKKKALPGIIVGLLITNIGYRLVIADEVALVSVAISILFVIGNLVEVFLFNYLIIRSKTVLKKLHLHKNGIKFTGAILIASLIGSIVGVLGVVIFYGFDDIVTIYLRWVVGNFTGMIIFGSLIFNSYYKDVHFRNSFTHVTNSVIYIIVFVFCTFFVFGSFGNDFLTFENFQISFVVLYIIAAFAFSYRMIIVNNLIYLIMVYLLLPTNIPADELSYQIIWLSLYVMALSSVASLVKNILVERNSNYNDMENARNSLEKIIISTNGLFNVQDEIPDNETESFSRKYLKDMFEIACNIYPKFERASCYLQGKKYVEYIACKGYDVEFLNDLQFISETFTWDFDEPKIVVQNVNLRDFPQEDNFEMYSKKYGEIKESMRFTLQIDETMYAGVSFDIKRGSEESFTAYDLENFKSFQTLMSSYYSVGILNSQNNNLKDDIVLSLVRTLELYDSYTGGHSEEVAELSLELANRLKLNQEEIRHIYWSSIVHDIGKIGLNSDVLNKNGKLTDEEYEEVKKHTLYGYNILSRSKDLSDIANTVRHHHEWWNGKGYPDGLRGIDIPYSSQILHVCDAVSAMAKDRVYKKAMTEMEIINELQNGLGKQFSPKVAKYMIKYIQDGELEKFTNKHKTK